jgi:hypothetical protein
MREMINRETRASSGEGYLTVPACGWSEVRFQNHFAIFPFEHQ